MTTAKIQYQGQLRCAAVHIKSGEKIVSDAPTDNKGKGEAFSPTDLLSTSLGMCMMTIMGIAAIEKEILFENVSAEVTKIMSAQPRKVQEIQITFSGNFSSWGTREWAIMKNAADTCPVKLSLDPTILIKLDWKTL
jgi:putative redox protein